MSILYSPSLGYMPACVLGVFILMLIAIGFYGWYKSRSSDEDFYLAGRKQGLLVTVLTIMATFFSSSAMLAVPGNVYKDGLVFMIFALNLPVAGVVVSLIGIRVWKLGRAGGFLTQGDLISDYYDGSRVVRFLVAMLGFLYILPYIVMQIRAGGLVSEMLFSQGGVSTSGWDGPYAWGSIIMTIILVIYILVGGMRSVAMADAVQGSLLLIGMIIAGVTIVLALGGPREYWQSVSAIEPKALSLPGYTDRYTMFAMWTVCLFGAVASMVQPAQWMRYYSAKSPATLRRSTIIFTAVLPACFLFGVMLVGLGARVLYPPTIASYTPQQLTALGQVSSGRLDPAQSELTPQMIDDYRRSDPVSSDPAKRFISHPEVGRSDQVLIAVLKDHTRSVFGVWGQFISSLILVSILAASMSTADSNLHAMSAVVTQDFYTKLCRPKAGPRERSWCNRVVIIGTALLALTLVMVGESNHEFAPLKMIIELQFVAIAFAGQLIPVTLDILFFRRGTKAGAIAGMICGLLVVTCFTPVPALLLGQTTGPEMAADLTSCVVVLKRFFDIGFCGLVPNIIVFALVSMMTKPVDSHKKKDYGEKLS